MRSLFYILFLILFSFQVFAIGASPAHYKVEYVPDKVYTYDLVARNNAGHPVDIFVSIRDSPISEYITVEPNSFTLVDYFPIHVTLVMPSDSLLLSPGWQGTIIDINEMVPSTGSGIAALTGVGHVVKVFVPYPGLYAEMTLNAENVNEGEAIPFEGIVKNRGVDPIVNGNLIIELYTKDGALIHSILERGISIESGSEINYYELVEADLLKPGIYSARARFVYGGEREALQTREFGVGSLNVEFTNASSTLYKNELGKYEVQIQSMWNDPIEHIYAEFEFEGQKEKTPSVHLNPWQKEVLSTYLDTRSLNLNDSQVKVTLYFEDETREKVFPVKIVDRPIEVVEEEPSKSYALTIPLNATTLLSFLLIVIVIVDVVYLISKHKSDKKTKE